MSDLTLDAVPAVAAVKPDKGDVNPYLDARQAWNSRVDKAFNAARTWQVIGVAALVANVGAVGCMAWLGAQPRFIPYVVEVDHLGEAAAVRQADRAAQADNRVVRASLAAFISSARSVTPDIAQQREATFRVYAMLETKDPARLKVSEWWDEQKKLDPFHRAETETVSVEISAINQISDSAWQVDWQETTRDRDGNLKSPSVRMRATLTVYLAPLGRGATAEEIARNPLGVFIQNFDWSQVG